MMMKKLLCALLCLTLALLSVSALADPMLVRITAKCADQNHVGTGWYGVYTMGDVEIRDNDVIDVVAGTYDFTATIADTEAAQDVGMVTDSYKVTANRLTKGFTVSLDKVDVMEDRGTYKGYWCEWYVTIDFEPLAGWEAVIH